MIWTDLQQPITVFGGGADPSIVFVSLAEDIGATLVRQTVNGLHRL
jgi:hypothetical protein